MRRFFEALQRDGTPYAQLDRIVDSLLLGPSHHSIGLQTADLVIASALAGRRALGDAASCWRSCRELRPEQLHVVLGCDERVSYRVDEVFAYYGRAVSLAFKTPTPAFGGRGARSQATSAAGSHKVPTPPWARSPGSGRKDLVFDQA